MMIPTINRNIEKEKYLGGLYLRLSVEEAKQLRKTGESVSSSIKSQELMLRRCFEDKNIRVVKVYIDDGLTGQRYDDRTDFQNAIRDLKAGIINTLGTKDMARLGRDLIDTCTYVQRTFPENKIRYIAYLDDFDNLYDDPTDERVVNKISKNDTFSKTISINVKNGKRERQVLGLYMGTYAPYGFKKHSEDKNRFVINPITGPIRKRMCELVYSGLSPLEVSYIFDKEKIPKPSESVGNKHVRKGEFKRDGWNASVIRKMVLDPINLGHTVQHKIEKENYKTKKMIAIPKKDWIIVKNTHEALITEEMAQIIEEQIMSRTTTRTRTYEWLLKGLLTCRECGKKLSVIPSTNEEKKRKKLLDKGELLFKSGRGRPRKPPKTTLYTRCNTYASSPRSKRCTIHSNNLEVLTNVVLDSVKQKCKEYIRKDSLSKIAKENKDKIEMWEINRQKDILSIKKELELINNKVMKLYDDRAENRISQADYERIYIVYNEQRLTLSDRLQKIETEEIDKSKILDIDKIINDFANAKEIDRIMLCGLIDRIEVSERQRMIKGLNSIQSKRYTPKTNNCRQIINIIFARLKRNRKGLSRVKRIYIHYKFSILNNNIK